MSAPERVNQYVEEALRQIDQAGGSQGVNLREVSRAIGCAHTNAYNYFDGLDGLLSRALVAALQRQGECSREALRDGPGAPRRALRAFVDGQIRFALEHPGWYRFIWLEPLRLPPPPEAIGIMVQAGEALLAVVRAAAGGRLSARRARLLVEDFHTWLHGALCKAIAGRTAPAAPEEQRRRILRRALEVLDELIGLRGARA